MGSLISSTTYTLFLVANLGAPLEPLNTTATPKQQHQITAESWYAIDFDLSLKECSHLAEELEVFLNDVSQAVCEPTYMATSEDPDGETPEKDY